MKEPHLLLGYLPLVLCCHGLILCVSLLGQPVLPGCRITGWFCSARVHNVSSLLFPLTACSPYSLSGGHGLAPRGMSLISRRSGTKNFESSRLGQRVCLKILWGARLPEPPGNRVAP